MQNFDVNKFLQSRQQQDAAMESPSNDQEEEVDDETELVFDAKLGKLVSRAKQAPVGNGISKD